MKYAVIALAFMVVALPSCCMRKKNGAGKAKGAKIEKAAKPCATGKCPTKAMPKMTHGVDKGMDKAAKAMPKR